MANNNDLVRQKLIDIMNSGLKLKAIALNVGVDSSDLSHFKNGRNSLKDSDIHLVSDYLDNVVIPQRQHFSQKKGKSTKLDLLRMRMKNSK